jgi:hypothetical protein
VKVVKNVVPRTIGADVDPRKRWQPGGTPRQRPSAYEP